MSFSSRLKKELSEAETAKTCCSKAQTYGIVLFGRHFSSSSITLRTENPLAAQCYRRSILQNAGVHTTIRAGAQFLECSIEQRDREKVLRLFGHTGTELSRRINRANIEEECCVGAFLRGVFLACGSMINPEKDYHLEFLPPRRRLAEDLCTILREAGLSPKTVVRGGLQVVYFKESEHIEDLLTLMSAVHSSLEIMEIKVYKDMRNRINRLTNCETANITKTVAAAAKQLQAIEKLEAQGRLQALPDDLYRLAVLRRENPEASISELCDLTGEGISRSGLNHRLRRIVEIAGE